MGGNLVGPSLSNKTNAHLYCILSQVMVVVLMCLLLNSQGFYL